MHAFHVFSHRPFVCKLVLADAAFKLFLVGVCAHVSFQIRPLPEFLSADVARDTQVAHVSSFDVFLHVVLPRKTLIAHFARPAVLSTYYFAPIHHIRRWSTAISCTHNVRDDWDTFRDVACDASQWLLTMEKLEMNKVQILDPVWESRNTTHTTFVAIYSRVGQIPPVGFVNSLQMISQRPFVGKLVATDAAVEKLFFCVCAGHVTW